MPFMTFRLSIFISSHHREKKTFLKEEGLSQRSPLMNEKRRNCLKKEEKLERNKDCRCLSTGFALDYVLNRLGSLGRFLRGHLQLDSVPESSDVGRAESVSVSYSLDEL